jgi:hypothetical protein
MFSSPNFTAHHVCDLILFVTLNITNPGIHWQELFGVGQHQQSIIISQDKIKILPVGHDHAIKISVQ